MGRDPSGAGAAPHFGAIRLAVVCPMANEVDCAERFVREVLEVLRPYKMREVAFFAVLDTVSCDGTLEVMRTLAQAAPELRVVYAPENRCVVDAYVRGYREALDHGADWILEIDAGYSHNPREIPRFLERIHAGSDCVFGSRVAAGGHYSGGLSRRWLVSRGGSLLANVLLGTRLSDMTSGFQLFRREALESILRHGLLSRGPFFQTEMKTHAQAFRVAEVPISYRPSGQIVRSVALGDALRTLWTLFKRRLSRAPTTS